MTRTNLELDEVLVARAMQCYGLTSKRAAVEFALQRLVGDVLTQQEVLDLEGVGWETDLESVRAGAPVPDV
ncbi:MAG TPA: type II toxin-antitoxin system VapB family antitoxin [Candidatus Micrarchaeia archaeon]|nr:type II toxin-antitoxin system VapB family antitoxin [Candidatus Micrarchaeia archaeon]